LSVPLRWSLLWSIVLQKILQGARAVVAVGNA